MKTRQTGFAYLWILGAAAEAAELERDRTGDPSVGNRSGGNLLQELINQIREAFDAVPQPSDEELLHPDCMDDCDILQFYGGVRWQDMSDEMIVYNYAALTAFSPKAFRYYLPAYLLWTLRNADSIEYVGEAALRALDPGAPSEMLHDFRKSHYSDLDAGQIEAVKVFLTLLGNHPDLGEYADEALLNHWLEA